jgi:uncharacterized membrane protein YkvA (DUF1232 family)
MTMVKKIKTPSGKTPMGRGASLALAVKRRTGMVAGPTAIRHLKALIWAFPDRAARIRDWAQEPGCPPALRRLSEFVAAYIANPADVLPENAADPLGYLDDAYLTARVYEATVLDPEWGHQAGQNANPDHELADQLEEARRVISDEAARIDRMLSLVAAGARRSGLPPRSLAGLG